MSFPSEYSSIILCMVNALISSTDLCCASMSSLIAVLGRGAANRGDSDIFSGSSNKTFLGAAFTADGAAGISAKSCGAGTETGGAAGSGGEGERPKPKGGSAEDLGTRSGAAKIGSAFGDVTEATAESPTSAIGGTADSGLLVSGKPRLSSCGA